MYVHFETCDSLREGEYVSEDQPDVLTFGPFDFVQLTYEWLRVGPEGEHIAAVDRNGLWRLLDVESAGGGLMSYRFSDVTINDEEG